MNVAKEIESLNTSELNFVLVTLTEELSRRTEDVQGIDSEEVRRTWAYSCEKRYFFREDFFDTRKASQLTLDALNAFIKGITKQIGNKLESYQLLQDHLYAEDLTQKKEKGEWVSPYGEEFDQEMEDWQNNPQYKYNTLREC